ncbi:MAG: hypothetical protein J0L92_32000 [Deltaproteobacteria bacterium]|nr:hypothetical protein [Deltaproteobacteria bacterium]
MIDSFVIDSFVIDSFVIDSFVIPVVVAIDDFVIVIDDVSIRDFGDFPFGDFLIDDLRILTGDFLVDDLSIRDVLVIESSLARGGIGARAIRPLEPTVEAARRPRPGGREAEAEHERCCGGHPEGGALGLYASRREDARARVGGSGGSAVALLSERGRSAGDRLVACFVGHRSTSSPKSSRIFFRA